ncbi:PREDICTED: tetratricopeptide repeat protein 25 isoform X1 [Nicrophorus vespilloides]|uniref:Outer dynein arm-docking complex subunit 4 n=1 Tax=Nicrophorus vespilloides TaxID=110193 RepID=A0ABM1MUA2_NICVS|nr:PREDICTED: tetratricopeptide repeat protein 25 isoform X1 [Nicrophorus vespilloides]
MCMSEKKRGRTASVLHVVHQKKESKLRYEEANCHAKSGNLLKAVFAYTKALELNPVEKNALVARSKCYIMLGQPENALKDAETALGIDKKYLKAIYQKAEALYYMGDFEHSLMYFHRGLHVRPDHQNFKLGVEKAQKAIENALGIGTKKRSSRNSTPVSTNRSKSCSKLVEERSQKSACSKKIKKSSRLLRELAVDKDYLDNLLMHPDIRCKHKEDVEDPVVNHIREAVEYLNKRQEFWRQQLPPNFT